MHGIERAGKLFRAVGLAGILALTPTLSACGPLADLQRPVATPTPRGPQPPTDVMSENDFYDSIANLPVYEQMDRIETRYSQYGIYEEIGRNYITPVWIACYIEASGSQYTPDEIRDQLKLILRYEDHQPGGMTINPVKRSVYDIYFNLGAFIPFEEMSHPLSNQERAYGISYLRNALTYALVSLDSPFRDSSLAIKDEVGRIDPEILKSQILLTRGFALYGISENDSVTMYIPSLSEMGKDIAKAYIIEKQGLQTIMRYPQAARFKEILDWLNFPADDFIRMHRESDLEKFVQALGAVSQAKRQDFDAKRVTADGLGIINILDSGNPPDLEQYLPGVMDAVFSRPVQYIK